MNPTSISTVSKVVKTGDLKSSRPVIWTVLVMAENPNCLVRLWSGGKELPDKAGKKGSGRILPHGAEERYRDETGIFLYSGQREGEEWKRDYVHFEAL